MPNPYNCTRPGNSFVGYERLRRKLAQGIRDGNSYALLGGRRCGKTSLLLQVAKDLEGRGLDGLDLGPLRALPRYLDIQALNELTPAALFGAIYQAAAQGLSLPRWSATAGSEYASFLAQIDAGRAAIEAAHGSHWVVVLLVDELDSAVARLPDDQFFQNLRNLLMVEVSGLHQHFRVIASGVKNMGTLISSGSSPLNNLRRTEVEILTGTAADELVAKGFPDGSFGAEARGALDELTGRHPYLMQGLLEFLWASRSAGTTAGGEEVRGAAREFQREHSDFTRWLDSFGPAEHAVYQAMARLPGGAGEIAALNRALPPELRPGLDDALTVLAYHGVIDDADHDRPRLAGTMFRDWYLKREARPPSPPTRSKVFVSYSRQDGEALARLQVHLEPLKDRIDLWDDTKLTSGDRWAAEIANAVESASIAILLVSADFLASRFIANDELPPLLRAAQNGGATILPVVVSPCSFEQHALNEFQAVNSPKRPLSSLSKSKREEIWQQLAQRVRQLVEST